MILSNRANKKYVNITLNGNNMSRVTRHEILGVMIDETLKFEVYVNKLSNKLLRSKYVNRQVSKTVPGNVTASTMLLCSIYSSIRYATY